MSSKKLIKLLERAGAVFDREGRGDHVIYRREVIGFILDYDKEGAGGGGFLMLYVPREKQNAVREGSIMPTRAHDWLRQAKRDLEHAREDLKSGYYEWGCFSAQQAAEKALKALYQHLHAEAWGHSIKKLLESLPTSHAPSSELIEQGAALDKLYFLTRYPNGFDIGAPEDYFNKKDLDEAIQYAANIIQFCDDKIPELR